MGNTKYPVELRERATCIALKVRQEPDSNRGAITRVAEHLGDSLNDNSRMIAVSTGHHTVAAPTHLTYTATKAGLEGVLHAVSPELAQRGITVNSVAPSIIDTELKADWINAPRRPRLSLEGLRRRPDWDP
jgi:NAD(P)-dependent dehydrogenase (short-subunit alcohol dehydrogenase family)